MIMSDNEGVSKHSSWCVFVLIKGEQGVAENGRVVVSAVSVECQYNVSTVSVKCRCIVSTASVQCPYGVIWREGIRKSKRKQATMSGQKAKASRFHVCL
jgi:hypothetical protein